MNLAKTFLVMAGACAVCPLLYARFQTDIPANSLVLATSSQRTLLAPKAPLAAPAKARKEAGLKKAPTLIERYRARPSEDLALKIIDQLELRPHEGECEELQLSLGKAPGGWLTIFFYAGYESEQWGIVSINAQNQVAHFVGDSDLFQPDAMDPVGVLTLNSHTPLLTLLEREGGSGGFMETMRLFVLDGQEWSAAGSIPLSSASRCNDYPELSGAGTPYQQRRVEISTKGQEIVLEGDEASCRRLAQGDRIAVERSFRKIIEHYRIVDGTCQRTRRIADLVKTETESLGAR